MDKIKEIVMNGVTLTVKNFPSLSTDNIIGWSGVKDEKGDEVPFSRENLAMLFEGTFELAGITHLSDEPSATVMDNKTGTGGRR